MSAKNESSIVIRGKEFVTRLFNKADKSAKTFFGTIKKGAKVITGFSNILLGLSISGGALGSLIFFTKHISKFGDQIDKLNARLGASTEALSEYKFVAETSGVAFNTLTMGWQRMTRRISEAAQNTGEARIALVELGLDAQKLNQLKPEEQFFEIAKAFDKIESSSEKVRLAMRLFDSEGVALVQILKKGADEIERLRETSKVVGSSISGLQADKFAKFESSVVELKNAFFGLGVILTDHFIQPLDKATKHLEFFNFAVKEMILRKGPHGLQEGLDLRELRLRKLDNKTKEKQEAEIDELVKKKLIRAELGRHAKRHGLSQDDLERAALSNFYKRTFPDINKMAGELGIKEQFTDAGFAIQQSELNQAKKQTFRGISDKEIAFYKRHFINPIIGKQLFDPNEEFLKLAQENQKKNAKPENATLTPEQQEALLKQYKLELNAKDSKFAQIDALSNSLKLEADLAFNKDNPAKQQAFKNLHRFDKLNKQVELFELDLIEKIKKAEAAKPPSLKSKKDVNTLIDEAKQQHIEPLRENIKRARNAETNKVVKLRLQHIDKLRQKELEASDEIVEGWKAGSAKISKSVQSHFQIAERVANETASSMTFAINDLALSAIEGRLKSFKEVANSFLKDIAASVSKIASEQAVGHLFGAFGKPSGFSVLHEIFGGKRAGGGPVGRGKAFLVGELGPELFIPATAGSVVPNKDLNSSKPINVQVNVVNNTNQEVEVEQSTEQISPEDFILNVVMNAADTNKRGFRDRFLR